MLCADSDIIHVNALGTSIFILNSYKVATDILDQKAGRYRYLLQQASILLPGEFIARSSYAKYRRSSTEFLAIAS